MLYLLALHIIFVVTWFAGLFYIVRLFVYHSEANEKPEPERSILISHFRIAERRLWYGITWPSAIGTYVFGIWLTLDIYGTNIPSWLWLKFIFVGLLTIYHLMCGRFFKLYQNNKASFTSMQMRMWNEVATIFLIAIVFIVVLKDMTNWIYGVVGLVVFSGLLMVAIRVYKKMRERN
jgi:putative membrane protein